MTDNFATNKPLITAVRLANNPHEATTALPTDVPLPSSLRPYETALIAELNRFPGSPVIAYVPEGRNRETLLQHVEARAREYEASNLKPIHEVRGYISVEIYLQNLRDLFLAVDIERTDDTVAPVTTFRQVIPAMVESFKDAEIALSFALETFEDVHTVQFLRERQGGKDLTHWLEELADDLEAQDAGRRAQR